MKEEKDIKTDRVFQYIYDGIKSGEFPSGQMLTEREIVKKLEVSRTPVREALRRLEKFGLVNSEPHKGVRVISMSKERISNLYQVRELLEGLGAKLISKNKNEKAIERLREIMEKAEQAVKEGDIDKLSNINSQFHMEIAKSSENYYLENIMHTLQSNINLLMATSLSSENRPIQNLKEHHMIIDAIESWDPELAEAVTKSHVRKAYNTALNKIDKLNS
ncbi:GntR family transcriptional regulator [Tuberibacillus sp. Marseille-P3662]|uniref:GntR family transcriptional regulator n=1 Tax=Tuberibacillus sp. Marseille-P3662 TaxID=1965358 RepID=UPI000A1C978D|nr:GntR family transcriptional regulator [Tuberibacillus sp. Marseille-P3662]